MKKPAIHFRSLRLRNNAGMDFPTCYANAPLLDVDKGRLQTTNDPAVVTCHATHGRITSRTLPTLIGAITLSHTADIVTVIRSRDPISLASWQHWTGNQTL